MENIEKSIKRQLELLAQARAILREAVAVAPAADTPFLIAALESTVLQIEHLEIRLLQMKDFGNMYVPLDFDNMDYPSKET